MYILARFLLLCPLLYWFSPAIAQHHTAYFNPQYHMIAHRGGVVDSLSSENSLSALKRAYERGYWMVEIDMRLTKDSVLVTQHDNNLKRSFGIDSNVSAMTWAQIHRLKDKRGHQMLQFEDVLRYCSGKMQVMIDNKIRGNDTAVFKKAIAMLKKYQLYEGAVTIGTDESTEYFTGKIKLSCTRRQLEENMQKPGFKASNYYLFSGGINKTDADWAREHDILAIGVINAFGIKSANPMEAAKTQADQLKAAGLTWFQVDSSFDTFFR